MEIGVCHRFYIDLNLNDPDALLPLLAAGFKDAWPLVQWMRADKIGEG